jgi:hypothetical protein
VSELRSGHEPIAESACPGAYVEEARRAHNDPLCVPRVVAEYEVDFVGVFGESA